MPKRRVTSKDVAEAAGVSQTTVSFVLNDVKDANISAATQQRVWEAARQLGYVPDVSARSLAQGTSNNIGLILIKPHSQVFADPFVPNVVTGFSEIIKTQEYRIVVEIIDDPANLTTISRMLRGGEVAGVLISGVLGLGWASEEILALLHDGYPVAMIDPVTDPDIHFVSIDHRAGVQQIAAHVARLGHHHIACIGYASATDYYVQERLQAFREGLRTAGLLLDERLVRYGDYNPVTGYQAARSLLQEDPLPTVIWGMNDLMALGAMAAVHDAGLRIPEDIAVVGYDDMRFAEFTCPALTTVSAPEIELGRQAAALLLALINDTPGKDRFLLKPQLIVRKSCGATLS
jgi:DNA-binding LacI/PurR family transcriptional regulator